MSKYTNELHINYQKSIKTFLQSYNNADANLSKQIDAFCRSCALVFWNQFNTKIELCVEALNELYTKESERIVYSTEEVAETMRFLDNNEVRIIVPDFYKNMVALDEKDKTNYSRIFAAGMQLVFLQFTLIDDEITFEEARLVTKHYQVMTDYCDEHSIKPFRNDVDPFSFVTNLEKTENEKKKTAMKQTSQKEKNIQKSAMDSLNSLIGLKSVKEEIANITNFARVQNLRKGKNLPTAPMSYHLVFTGNPGTGKTTVARLVAQIYKELGILSKGHLIEADSSDLVAGYVGQTAIKTHELIEKARGGVLFIDEAYTLVDNNSQGYGREAIDTLLKDMEDLRDDFVVIVAGYNSLMQQFIESNPGLKSRFNRYIQFEDYSAEEMLQIFELLCTQNQYCIAENAKKELQEYFEYLLENKDDDFGNGRTVRNYFENVITKQANRIATVNNATTELLTSITLEDVKWERNIKETSLDECLKELNTLIGLSKVKNEIDDLIKLVELQKKRKEQGLTIPSLSLHLVFSGNPGTGKTTVARCVSKIYKSLGLLSKGHLIETDRSGLVAGYVGQTAIKTQEVIDKAIGGVLFIDEAYTLTNESGNDYGQEAVDTLLKAMEDNRDNLVVIVAGYDKQMSRFIQSNPGLASRFNRYIHFDDYSAEEMMQIFLGLCEKNQYEIEDNAKLVLLDYFSKISISDIGNGRGVRNIFEKAVTNHAKRVSGISDFNAGSISTICIDDIIFLKR